MQALAFRSVITFPAFGVAVEHGAVGIAFVDEFGGLHFARFYQFAIVIAGLINNHKAIALTQVAVEIDIGGKDLRHLNGDLVGDVN